MDEILIYLINLFRTDPAIAAIFLAAGASSVSVLSPKQRTQATYPRLIVDGDMGRGHGQGDVLPRWFDGSLHIEAIARKNDEASPPVNEFPLATVRALEARIQLLVLGNRKQAVQGLQGTTVGANYRIDSIRCNWQRLLPTEDATIERWGGSYSVMIDNYTV